jgi:predicted esterase YcpF (UPF0227 family)
MILYLHGFRSSPQSYKARVMQQHMQDWGVRMNFLSGAVAITGEAIAQAEAIIATADPAQRAN